MPPETEIFADVLVIGGGMAGAVAAIEAARHGGQVVLVDKGVLGRSGSSCTAGGALAFPSSGPGTMETGDSSQSFYEDLMVGGEGMADPQLVRGMVEEVVDRVKDLESMGVRFQRLADGRYYQRKGLGQSYPRSCGPQGGGPQLMLELRREVLHRGVRIWEDTMAFHLLKSGETVAGALGLHLPTGQIYVFRAKATVLAAGSVTGLYRFASANFTTQGDSFAMALAAGAELANLEFVEFTFVPAPRGVVISSGGATPFPSRGAHLYNSLGERFMARYDPRRMEQSTRAIVVQAMERESQEGRGPIMMDASVISPEYRSTIEGDVMNKIRSVGVDPWQERFAWRTAVHSALGGLVIDSACGTSVPGLFACGEAATGIHGANRLSGVALTECAVFGYRAGRGAALFARSSGKHLPSSSLDGAGDFIPAGWKGGPLEEVKHQLQDMAWDNIGIFRREDKLRQAADRFQAVRRQMPAGARPEEVSNLAGLLEVRNLALIGDVIARAALHREETRGQHMREDFPHKDREWGHRRVLVRQVDGELSFRVAAVPVS